MADRRSNAGGAAVNEHVSGILACALVLAGCGDGTSLAREEAAAEAVSTEYVVMGEDLAELKSDFNAAVDQVRLLFIVGPT